MVPWAHKIFGNPMLTFSTCLLLQHNFPFSLPLYFLLPLSPSLSLYFSLSFALCLSLIFCLFSPYFERSLQLYLCITFLNTVSVFHSLDIHAHGKLNIERRHILTSTVKILMKLIFIHAYQMWITWKNLFWKPSKKETKRFRHFITQSWYLQNFTLTDFPTWTLFWWKIEKTL